MLNHARRTCAIAFGLGLGCASALLVAPGLPAEAAYCPAGSRVRFVRAGRGDLKIRLDNAFPDMKIRLVQRTPRAGEWQIVEAFEDMKVEIVNWGPATSVRFVSYQACP